MYLHFQHKKMLTLKSTDSVKLTIYKKEGNKRKRESEEIIILGNN